MPLAQLMRVEQHQATMINWLIGADHSPIETTIGYEQTAIEVTASVAQLEPDPYLAQGYRYALLEDFDHLYRYSALLDRLEGKDANNITQGYTDIVPARPTLSTTARRSTTCCSPIARDASLATKLHALTLTGGEYQTHDYYMNIGPLFADPLARQLYAEIASVESQHITHYGSHAQSQRDAAGEAAAQRSRGGLELQRPALAQESQSAHQGHLGALPRLRARPLAGGDAAVQGHERRDPPRCWATACCRRRIQFESQREFVREVVAPRARYAQGRHRIRRQEGRRSDLDSLARPSEQRRVAFERGVSGLPMGAGDRAHPLARDSPRRLKLRGR